jgi:inner membrane protein involved in colicin E2 resistance
MIRPSLRWHSASPVLRLLVIGVLLALLQIPSWMIRDVVVERQVRKTEAVTDIVGKWGGAQTLVGPILRIPYSAYREARDAQGHAFNERVTEVAYFLPRTLAISGDLRAEQRHRGLFGLLQLSFAEHYGFNVAFAVASAAVVGLVTLYGRSMLGGWWRALVLGGVLSGLYAYLYTIINAEDDSLLGGSLALFVGLAVTMWLTRRFDWSGNHTEAEVEAV